MCKDLKDLDNIVFNNFANISKIPRNSGCEKAVSDYITEWANNLGLDVTQDEISNLIIRKPASSGYESHDAVILQAHLDMVCEKRSDSNHDFSKDPIELIVDDDWLKAKDTSLGADNGIGVAIAMSILEADDIKHPPLEVVFTVQEETSFDGAANVDKSSLIATRMINLDHASETELIIGSCGGMGVNFELPIERESSTPNGLLPYEIKLRGLLGGHSGEDIHRGRGNAIMLLLRLIEMIELPLISIDGGTNRLAIPREASAVVLTDDKASLKDILKNVEAEFRAEYVTAENLFIDLEDICSSTPPLTSESFQNLRLALRAYPNGIVRMFDDMEGIVESSDNIGIIETSDDKIKLVSELRGAYDSTIKDMLDTIKLIADFTGSDLSTFASYSAWKSQHDSALKGIALKTYEDLYERKMTPIALHAGLESAFFAEANPNLDIVSIGPNCQNFHSPDEKVSISSTIRVYDYLKKLLSGL